MPACACACVRIWDDSIYARYQRGSFDDDTEDAGGRLTPRFRVDLSTEHKPLFKDPSSFFLSNLMRGAPNSFHVSSCRSNTTLGCAQRCATTPGMRSSFTSSQQIVLLYVHFIGDHARARSSNNGVVEGHAYFTCDAKRGCLVAKSKVTLAEEEDEITGFGYYDA